MYFQVILAKQILIYQEHTLILNCGSEIFGTKFGTKKMCLVIRLMMIR